METRDERRAEGSKGRELLNDALAAVLAHEPVHDYMALYATAFRHWSSINPTHPCDQDQTWILDQSEPPVTYYAQTYFWALAVQ